MRQRTRRSLGPAQCPYYAGRRGEEPGDGIGERGGVAEGDGEGGEGVEAGVNPVPGCEGAEAPPVLHLVQEALPGVGVYLDLPCPFIWDRECE